MSSTRHRIFISHSHKDDAFGTRLIEDLCRVFPEKGAVWYDSHGGLLGGTNWWRTIVSEITSRTVFLVILSFDAMESKWVNDEIDLAWIEKNSPRGMLLLPVLRHPCMIRADLRSLQVLDFQEARDYDLAFEELLSALGVIKSQAAPQAVSQSQRSLLPRLMPQVESAFAAQDWPDVIRKADYLLKHASEDLPVSLYYWYGVALQQLGQTEQAQGAFEMALVMVTDRQQRLQMLRSYAELLIVHQRWDELLPLATEALHLIPNDPTWVIFKQWAQGKYKTKEEWIEEGNRLYNLRCYEEALLADEQAIQLDPNDAVAYFDKGIVLDELKRYEEALLACEQAIRLDPNYALAYDTKGDTLKGLKRYEEALLAYEQAIRLGPNYANTYGNKGNALYNLKHYEEALMVYDQTIRLDPNSAVAYYNKGLVFQNMNRNDEAQVCFEKAKQLRFTN